MMATKKKEFEHAGQIAKRMTALQTDLSQWILDQTGYEPESREDWDMAVKLVTFLRAAHQTSEHNQERILAAREAKYSGVVERAEARAEKARAKVESARAKVQGKRAKIEPTPGPEEVEEAPEPVAAPKPGPRRGRKPASVTAAPVATVTELKPPVRRRGRPAKQRTADQEAADF